MAAYGKPMSLGFAWFLRAARFGQVREVEIRVWRLIVMPRMPGPGAHLFRVPVLARGAGTPPPRDIVRRQDNAEPADQLRVDRKELELQRCDALHVAKDEQGRAHPEPQNCE